MNPSLYKEVYTYLHSCVSIYYYYYYALGALYIKHYAIVYANHTT